MLRESPRRRSDGHAAGGSPVRIDLENEWAWCGERRLELTPRTFAVLRHLVDRAGRLVTKDEILAAVWSGTVVSEAALTSCIRDIRRALGDSSRGPRFIETVHRRGFRFIGPVATAGVPLERAPSVAEPPAAAAGASLLVGRARELARLHAASDVARSGHRRLVFVTGEAGIGKTALVERFLEPLAADPEVRIGRGQCVEQYGAGEAYLPVLDALGRLGREAGGADLVGVLRRYAPTWLVQMPALLADGDVEAVQRRAQGATRERMLREAIDAFDALTREAPLVLVLEDLHWSDSATVGLLAMLARRRDPARLLIVATYRPGEGAAAGHPLASMQRELQAHGRCEEIALGFLAADAVQEYLQGRFPGSSFPPPLARTLHRNTSGNPLFLVNVVDDLVRQGHVRPVDGRFELVVPVAQVAAGVPETLWQLVERRIERLDPEEQAVLAVGAVAGAEFSAALAACDGLDVGDAERWCAGLARRGQFLRLAGAAEWPDGTVAGRYAFVHAIYQNVLYARVPIGHRVGLHLRIGARLEGAHGARAAEIAGELAMHFEHGRDFERAFTYRRLAAQTALRQHAYEQAADHATRALALVAAFPDSPARVEHELVAHVQLGTALTALEGWAAPAVADTFAHVHGLCMRLGPIPQTFPVLFALSRFHVSRGDLPRVREVAAHLAQMADAHDDPAMRLGALNASGVARFYGGDFAAALDELERGMAMYDPERHGLAGTPVPRTGDEVGVSCALHAAWALWILGQPEPAAIRMREALAWASAVDSPFTRVFAQHVAAALSYCRGEPDAVRALVEEADRLSREHGFGLLSDVQAIYSAWLDVLEGRGDDAVARMRDALAGYRAKGAELQRPMFVGMLAEVCGRLGRAAEGLAVVIQELAAPPGAGLAYWDAELHRCKGELELACGAASDAEASLRRAREIARRQQARSLERRAARALAALRERLP